MGEWFWRAGHPLFATVLPVLDYILLKKKHTVSKAVAAVSHYYTAMTQHIKSDVNKSDSSCCVCNNDYK